MGVRGGVLDPCGPLPTGARSVANGPKSIRPFSAGLQSAHPGFLPMTIIPHQPAVGAAASRLAAGARLAALLALPLVLAPRAPGRAQDAPAPASNSAEVDLKGHVGPPVAPPGSPARGPARWVAPIHDRFDLARALGDAIFIDGFYRTPASPHYDACLDRIRARLEAAGFSAQGSALRLRVVEKEMRAPAWWPLAASLELGAGADREVLLAFGAPGDAHRTMVPQGAPSAHVEGPAAFELDAVVPGGLLVTRSPLSSRLIGAVRAKGGAGVLSASTFPFTKDPGGGDRHLDAIQFTRAPRAARGGPRRGGEGEDLPTIAVCQISPRVLARIQGAGVGAPLRLHVRTREESRPLRTLIAEVIGDGTPEEAVAIASHLQEPGAGDNAAGAAGLCAAASGYATALQAGELPRPRRTLAFVFGDEMGQSAVWLEDTDRKTVAALSADMLGQSPERTGAVVLLERTPDPGALHTIPPDAHTPWGAGRVSARDLRPNGVNVVCREALRDVALHVGGWRTSENPWEGGSDHDVFNRRGIPAALMWHFTDFTYHTSLDRMGMIDGDELRRTCAAIVSAGLALADMGPADVERHLASNELERRLRVDAATSAGNAAAVDAWESWCDGCASWLRAFGG